MAKCIVTGDDITAQNDSEAHIIASALGGRLHPRGILSRKGNNILDRKVDNPYVAAMQYYMTIVHGNRDRGGKPTLVLGKDSTGKRYLFGGNEIKALDHEYDVVDVDGKPEGTIKATSQKQLKDLLGKTKKDFNLSDSEVEKIIENAKSVCESPGVLNSQILAGPAVEFPATFTMAALFCAYHQLPLPDNFRAYIENFDEKKEPRILPSNTFYFIHKKEWFRLDAEIGHCLIYYASAKRKQAIFFAQLFNMLGIAVTMPYEGNSELSYTYGVDIIEGKNVPVYVNTESLSELDWSATHNAGESELYAVNQERGQRLMKVATDRTYNLGIQEIWKKHLDGKPMDSRITKEERAALYLDFKDYLTKWIKPEFLEQTLKHLKKTLQVYEE